MSINSIDFIAPDALMSELTGIGPESGTSSFSAWLAKEIEAVDQQIQSAELHVQQLATGEQDNLHQVMMSLEKAKLSMELVVQVRNKLLEGYQEIMRMQV